ncbi:hypothetical protein VC83_00203 [Pseudogymnoascus destructans]|uniref:Uncharacterized protein n=2 Tax=Pseudogymnoascus destructans TaxID=655981 RepID=L8GCJ4_PSED2|nr:uncharacterized protein VC83_00203 [Pseudogymnoascus destructans]ELR10554.1 hypothetical protein GMDG_04828 [Pseudogymnoascus destructans 20631-21]OAF62915.1 hypothetical protein VC83_00203 [Pseudogymnoascus destructans]
MRAEESQDSGSTGGALRHSKLSAWGNMVAPVGFVAQEPQLLQEKYTDDSMIVVIVMNVVSAQKPKVVEGKKSFMSKFKKDKEPSTTKAVRMPRCEYKKFFAKDKDGNYIGTEAEREWMEEKLEDEFGQYQKEV